MAMKFADEAALITLALVVILANISMGHQGILKQDESLAAATLYKQPSANPALYSKLFSTTLTVTDSNGLITKARANEQIVPNSSTQVAGTSLTQSPLNTIDEDGLATSIPDSIKPLLDNQIKIYETQGGDTLGSISKQFDIDINTIKWSNNLTSDTIKPGWYLVIPSVKGVLVLADNDTTIAGIARKFKCSEEQIISYNGLDGADSVEPGQYIMCPGGSVATPPKAIAKARTVGINYSSIPDVAGSSTFVRGNCTWYVARKMKITFHGNAKDWFANAQRAGYKTGQAPLAGSAVVTSRAGRYGHVAFVESVNPAKGTIYISEMNYEGLGVKSYRTIEADSVVGYIYPQ